jgi:hypothetical protein
MAILMPQAAFEARRAEAIKGPYIVWKDYGCEGWQPESHGSLVEALQSDHGSPESYVLTKRVSVRVHED